MRPLAKALFVLLVLGASAPAEAQRDVGRSTLIGLPGVHVYVEEVNPEAERDGLSKSGIQTQTELLLRQAGIRVFTDDEYRATRGLPLSVVRRPQAECLYGVNPRRSTQSRIVRRF